MNRHELTDLIHEPERPKLDFKRRSWDLAIKKGKGEFIKDILAMANAPGETGYLIIGVGDEPSRPLESIEGQGLSDERLQQIVKTYIEPPLEFHYDETDLHGNTIAIVTIPPSSARPHWAKQPIGDLRDHTFFTRRGSTTDLATLSELEQMFRERPSKPEAYGGWSTQLLWNRKEHIRLVPCLFLEKWEQKQSDVMTTDEVRAAVEAVIGEL